MKEGEGEARAGKGGRGKERGARGNGGRGGKGGEEGKGQERLYILGLLSQGGL